MTKNQHMKATEMLPRIRMSDRMRMLSIVQFRSRSPLSEAGSCRKASVAESDTGLWETGTDKEGVDAI